MDGEEEQLEEEGLSYENGGAGLLPTSDGWESVARPPLPPEEEEHGRGWQMVVVGREALAYDDGCSVFPPRDHEGLHDQQSLITTPEQELAPGGGREAVAVVPSSSSSSNPPASFSGGGGEGWWIHQQQQQRQRGGKQPFSELARRVVVSWLEVFYSKLPRQGLGVGRGGEGLKGGAVWSVATLAGMVGVLLYLRLRHRWEKLRLFLLIQEKDQKISQLLLQIAQMNEVISARRRVAVLRSA